MAVGDGFMCALTTAGAVLCWGANNDGELGNGTSGGLFETPATVHGLSSGVRALSAGGSDACAVTGSGAAKCWGSNANGSLGDGNAQQNFSAVPVQVKGLRSGQAAVSAGAYHTNCAVSTGGGVKCWGYNYDGTLGDGTENDSPVPVGVRGLSRGVKAESESTYTGCALTTTARVRCWGYVPFQPYLSDTPLSLPWFQ